MSRNFSYVFRLLVLIFPFLAARSSSPRITGFAIVLGNLLPLLGVLFFNWSIMEILWIYWAESAVIGGFNILSMLLAASHDEGGRFEPLGILIAIPISAFFTVHYGGFMAGHAVFLYLMPEIVGGLVDVGSGGETLKALFDCVADRCSLTDYINSPVLAAVAGLFGSHLVTWFFSFVKTRQYHQAKTMELMGSPYPRIIIMHITIILGMFALIGFTKISAGLGLGADAMIAPLGVWIVLKIIVDLRMFQRSLNAQQTTNAVRSGHPSKNAAEQ